MADTTLTTILQRFQAVLEGPPFFYLPARDAFSHDRQPNSVLDQSYWLEDAGHQQTRPLGNLKAARLDRITVYLARKLAFAPRTTVDTLETDLLTVERYLKDDGPDQSYHVDLVSRRVSRPEARDLAIGSLTLEVDYDVDEAVA